MSLLFPELINPEDNLLPLDGIVNDYGCIYDVKTAQVIFDYLMENTPWQHDEYIKEFTTANNHAENPEVEIKHIITARKMAWYAQHETTYIYAGSPKPVYAWSPAILKIKTLIEQKTNETFNSCLLNLYPSGSEGMAWHSDNASDIVKDTAIASLSFGAERKFMFKHIKTKKRIELWLASGQLIVMRGSTQRHWLHTVPKTKTVNEPRINLTFRTVV